MNTAIQYDYDKKIYSLGKPILYLDNEYNVSTAFEPYSEDQRNAFLRYIKDLGRLLDNWDIVRNYNFDPLKVTDVIARDALLHFINSALNGNDEDYKLIHTVCFGNLVNLWIFRNPGDIIDPTNYSIHTAILKVIDSYDKKYNFLGLSDSTLLNYFLSAMSDKDNVDFYVKFSNTKTGILLTVELFKTTQSSFNERERNLYKEICERAKQY
jgi:hypothetical protein